MQLSKKKIYSSVVISVIFSLGHEINERERISCWLDEGDKDEISVLNFLHWFSTVSTLQGLCYDRRYCKVSVKQTDNYIRLSGRTCPWLFRKCLEIKTNVSDNWGFLFTYSCLSHFSSVNYKILTCDGSTQCVRRFIEVFDYFMVFTLVFNKKTTEYVACSESSANVVTMQPGITACTNRHKLKIRQLRLGAQILLGC